MKKAFTLIELLVVIAIIAILAAILFPVFAQAKDAAKKSACLSNMKQMGVAFALYLSDSNGVYPSCDNDKAKISGKPPEPETPEQDGEPERDWTITTQPYIRNFDILRCGSDGSLKARNPKEPDLLREYRTSYTINGWAEYDLSESSVSRPSNWILLAERNNVLRGPKTWWMFYWWTWQGAGSDAVWPPTLSPDPTSRAAEDLSLDRHAKTPNWLYGDGHAKAATFSAVWKAGNENQFWPNPN